MRKPKRDLPTFSHIYYILDHIISSSDFQKEVKWLLNRYKKFELLVPKDGFSSRKVYESWCKDVVNKYTKLYESLESKKAFALEFNPKNLSLPPLPGKFITMLLTKFNIDPDNKEYRDFFTQVLFFKKSKYLHKPFGLSFKRDPKTKKWRLFIELYPYTKLEHIKKEWASFVEPAIKKLPGYVERNKAWENHQRDRFIYQTYLEIKKKLVGKRASKNKDGFQTIDIAVWEIVKKKYSRINLGEIKLAVSRYAKSLKVGRKEISKHKH